MQIHLTIMEISNGAIVSVQQFPDSPQQGEVTHFSGLAEAVGALPALAQAHIDAARKREEEYAHLACG